MRLSELSAREDHDAILVQTLARAFGERAQVQTTVTGGGREGQRWWVQPLLSAFYVPGVRAKARRFLADGFRFTRRRARVLPQFVLGTALASRAGLWGLGRRAFGVSPAVSGAQDLVILPGNQRIRLFDFARGVTRVVRKAGFPEAVLEAERRLRAEAGAVPGVPILAAGEGFFEEPIWDGYTLSRCPPWLNYGRACRAALARLDAWSAAGAREEAAGPWAEATLAAALAALDSGADRQRAAVRSVGPRLVGLASGLGRVSVGPSHGDAQPGNVLISRRGRDPVWIDWEFAGERARLYDRFVFGLGVRWPAGLGPRMRRYVRGEDAGGLLVGLPADRRAAIAMGLLEELRFRSEVWAKTPATASPELLAVAEAAREIEGLA